MGTALSGRRANWAGNIVYRASELAKPTDLAGLQAVVRDHPQVRAVGTGHSFNRIADTPGVLISLAGLPAEISIDAERAAATVPGGITYQELAPRLTAAGWALPTLASLPHLTVAGACATATHGSGDGHGNLATQVSAMQLVGPDGELRTLARHRDGDRFRGAVAGLGALGIVATLTLDLVPAFEVQQYVYQGLPAAMLRSHFDEIFGSGYSVSVFTGWQGTQHDQVWVKQRAGGGGSWRPEPRWMDATLADRPLHPIPGQPARFATEQLGVPGPWHARLPHFRAEFTPSAGAELQSEYLLPRQRAAAAFDALASLATVLAPVLQICEIRTVAPDDLWLSPSYQRDTVALHFTWIKDTAAVTPVVAAIDHLLAPLGARPHWAKLFATAPHAVRALYPRSADFQQLLRDLDPAGKFRNSFVARYFPGQD
ncbi:MAG TPA: D-arabinono-1,4-lactone oxidase [Streptosporangiaceae bacterium]